MVANVPCDPNSGAAGTVFATNAALRKLGHDVDEVWSEQLGPRRIAHGNLHSLLEQPRAFRKEVARAVAGHDYDVVIISQPQGYLAAEYLKRIKFPGVVLNRSHGLELRVDAILPEWHRRLGVPESRLPWLTKMLRPLLHRQSARAVRAFDGFVLPCREDLEFLKDKFPHIAENAVVIHHGVPDEFLERPVLEMTSSRQKRLLYVGQYAFIKGHDLLVQIVSQSLRKWPELTMTWVTDQWAHEKIISRLDPSIRDRVTLSNWVAQSELIPLLDSHGVFIFPSFFEGYGKAFAEAIARGMFVVASDTGGMRDLLQSVPYSLCPVGDVDAFVNNIGSIMQTEVKTGLAAEAAQRVGHLSWANCAKQFVDFSQKLLAAR